MHKRTHARVLVAALAAGLAILSARAQDKKAEHSAVKPVPREGNPLKQHESFVEIAKKGGVDLLFVGDSITNGWRNYNGQNGRGGKRVFDKHFAPLKAANFGIGGDRTQHVLWRLQNGELDGIQPKVVMLMIGTNNTGGNDNSAEQIADGVKAIVAEVHKKSPSTKVLLLGVFPRGKGPNAPEIKARREKIKQINDSISKLDDGGKTVKYMDIGDKFLEKDGSIAPEVMYDALHLTEKGYQIWADAVKGPIEELLGKK